MLAQAREGDWYPAGLSFSDMRGLAGYKIFLSVALLLGEGAFIMIKAALLGKPREVPFTPSVPMSSWRECPACVLLGCRLTLLTQLVVLISIALQDCMRCVVDCAVSCG